MKAMILAAGKGTRVRPITNVVPKPMIPLVGKPIMQTIIEHLRDSGFDEIIVNTSHLAPLIEDYFGDGSNFGVRMAYSFEGQLTNGKLEGQAIGSAGGMKRIQDFSGLFDDTFLVLCGDALVDVDLREAVRFHRERGAMATIILREFHVRKCSATAW
jgi:mannose-1-phosphate guanylyltransferase